MFGKGGFRGYSSWMRVMEMQRLMPMVCDLRKDHVYPERGSREAELWELTLNLNGPRQGICCCHAQQCNVNPVDDDAETQLNPDNPRAEHQTQIFVLNLGHHGIHHDHKTYCKFYVGVWRVKSQGQS